MNANGDLLIQSPGNSLPGNRRHIPVALLLACMAFIPNAGAGDGKNATSTTAPWPTISGNFQNTSAIDDPKFKPPFRLKWATRTEGQMKSTPVIGGGRVYAQTVNGLITAVDQQTGRIAWRNYHTGVLPDSQEQNRTSPLYAEGRLYYAYYPGGFYCVDAATGKELWKDPDGVRLAGRFSALWHNGMVFYPFWVRSQDKKTRYVIFKALDAATGKEVWRKEYPDFSNPNSVLSPAPAVSPGCIGDGVLYVSLGSNEAKREGGKGLMLALDPGTGKEVWKSEKYAAGGGGAYVSYHSGRVYVAGTGSPYRCLDAKTGDLVWETDVKGKGVFGSAVSSNGVALRTYGSPAAVYDIATGKPLTGQDGKPVTFGRGGSTGCSALIIVNGEWGIQHSGGETRRLSIGRIDRTESVWDWQLAGRACPGSAVADGCIYTPSGGDGLLFCFEPDDGKPPPAPVYTQHVGASPPMPKIGADDWPQF
ncbi:MAG: hypothetical protein C0404_09065, partial [Verrucomicrobia bacterium]|nr:hypothetical protein [Verrucomicrobiota bacterium]